MLERERQYTAKRERCFLVQPNVSIGNRAMLIDWLVDVCEECRFGRETFHLAVNYFDTYVAGGFWEGGGGVKGKE